MPWKTALALLSLGNLVSAGYQLYRGLPDNTSYVVAMFNLLGFYLTAVMLVELLYAKKTTPRNKT